MSETQSRFGLGVARHPLSSATLAEARNHRGMRKMEGDITAAEMASGSLRSLTSLCFADTTTTLLQGVLVADVSEHRKQTTCCGERHCGLCQTADHKIIDECKRI